MKKLLLGIMILGAFAGCGSKDETKQEGAVKTPMNLEEITTAAKAEGEVNSVGMPDAWANWVFDKAREELKEIGFEKFCTFEKRKVEYRDL